MSPQLKRTQRQPWLHPPQLKVLLNNWPA
uniref:Uncharacterized protein n=1 Tax=Arundo donax TaxID=35708 RepID=A0A0A9ABY8_ARUDO